MAKNIYAGMGKKGVTDLWQAAVRGVIELQNAVYPGSPYPVPQVVSAAQLSGDLHQSMEVTPKDRSPEPGLER